MKIVLQFIRLVFLSIILSVYGFSSASFLKSLATYFTSKKSVQCTDEAVAACLEALSRKEQKALYDAIDKCGSSDMVKIIFEYLQHSKISKSMRQKVRIDYVPPLSIISQGALAVQFQTVFSLPEGRFALPSSNFRGQKVDNRFFAINTFVTDDSKRLNEIVDMRLAGLISSQSNAEGVLSDANIIKKGSSAGVGEKLNNEMLSNDIIGEVRHIPAQNEFIAKVDSDDSAVYLVSRQGRFFNLANFNQPQGLNESEQLTQVQSCITLSDGSVVMSQKEKNNAAFSVYWIENPKEGQQNKVLLKGMPELLNTHEHVMFPLSGKRVALVRNSKSEPKKRSCSVLSIENGCCNTQQTWQLTFCDHALADFVLCELPENKLAVERHDEAIDIWKFGQKDPQCSTIKYSLDKQNKCSLCFMQVLSGEELLLVHSQGLQVYSLKTEKLLDRLILTPQEGLIFKAFSIEKNRLFLTMTDNYHPSEFHALRAEVLTINFEQSPLQKWYEERRPKAPIDHSREFLSLASKKSTPPPSPSSLATLASITNSKTPTPPATPPSTTSSGSGSSGKSASSSAPSSPGSPSMNR